LKLPIAAGDRLQAAWVLPDDGQGEIQRRQEPEPGSCSRRPLPDHPGA